MIGSSYGYKNAIHTGRGDKLFIFLREHDFGIFSRNALVSNHTSYLIWYKLMAKHNLGMMVSTGLNLT